MRLHLFLLLLLLVLVCRISGEDGGDADNDGDGDGDGGDGNDGDGDADADDNDAADDADAQDNQEIQYGDDYIQDWGNYAVLPIRCIVYNDVDVIVFSVFEQSFKQCSDEPQGTYIVPVPLFVNAYLQQMETNEQDKGNDDYVTPDEAMYTECQRQVIENQEFYLQLGCTNGDTKSLSVNIYKDNTCDTRDEENGDDDSNIDVSALQVPFRECQACVNYFDVQDDQVDDQFYENKKLNAPFCSTVWQYREECNRKCQKQNQEKTAKAGWNTSDKILLGVLTLFAAGMLGCILQKRRQMSNKDALLEQAAMSAAGLQQAHVIGIFCIIVIVVIVFGLLGLKNITWALLLIMNTALFGYLMKLTIDSGVSTGEMGPDGTIIRHDSDDSSMDSSRASNQGNYVVPAIT